MTVNDENERNIRYVMQRAKHHGVSMDERALRQTVYGKGWWWDWGMWLVLMTAVVVVIVLLIVSK
jgi:hypothetical protein